MHAEWENQFATWARPLSETEETRCENAKGMIAKALKAHPVLATKDIGVFAQGSYRNGTNVRAESDVDIAVCCYSTVNPDYQIAPNLNNSVTGITTPATYSERALRRDVGQALTDYFGSDRVTAGNKALEVHANSYRIDADVVPCIEQRLYKPSGSWFSGTAIYPVRGGLIVNWPEQNYENGVAKNERTGTSFKKLVRVIKNLRNDMVEANIAAAEPIPSYLIECLVWNVPDEGFAHSAYHDDVRYILAHIFNDTRTDDLCQEWPEENELKYLFGPHQPWSRKQVNDFVHAAWNYIGFE